MGGPCSHWVVCSSPARARQGAPLRRPRLVIATGRKLGESTPRAHRRSSASPRYNCPASASARCRPSRCAACRPGIERLDELLGGGLPRGHLSEIVGGPSSGRTALLHALLASATRRGEVAAVVDLPDALDPPSLARAGADLERVLWVRPPSPQIALKCAELILAAGGFGVVALDSLGARAARAAAAARLAAPGTGHATRRGGVSGLCAAAARRRRRGRRRSALTPRRVRWNGRLFDGIASHRGADAQPLRSGGARHRADARRAAHSARRCARPSGQRAVAAGACGGRRAVAAGGVGRGGSDPPRKNRMRRRMRIACIHVAAFPLAAWCAPIPSCAGQRPIVTDAPGPRARIVACAPEAVQRGVAVDMTAAQAVAIASDLIVRAASPAAEHAAQAALCDVAYSCSPRVEEGGLGTVYCDADGLQGLYASEARAGARRRRPGARARPRGVGRHRRDQDRRPARGARRRRLRGDPAARGVAVSRAAADPPAGARCGAAARRWRAGASARSAIWRRCRPARWRRGSAPPARSWRAAPAARTSIRWRRARCRCTSRRRRSSTTASTASSRSCSSCAACSTG